MVIRDLFLLFHLTQSCTTFSSVQLLSRVRLCATHRRQPIRLLHLWDSPGKNTGAGCHFLLQCTKVKSQSEATQSCPTLCDPTDCSPPGSSVHGIFQARVLEWGAIAFSDVASLVPYNLLITATISLHSYPSFLVCLPHQVVFVLHTLIPLELSTMLDTFCHLVIKKIRQNKQMLRAWF